MNKKISLGITISLMAIAAVITFILTMNFSLKMVNDKVKSTIQREEIYTKLSEIDSFVRNNYGGTIDEDVLMEELSIGYMKGLQDEYAEFFTAEEYLELSVNEAGYTVGLGLEVEKDASGYMSVTTVDENGAAYAAGIRAGNVIVAVNNKDVIAIGYETAAKALKADEGISVVLTVRLDGEDTDYSVTSTRVDIPTVSAALLDDIGCIRISGINGKTSEQFKIQLDRMISSGAKGLIFDIRDTDAASVEATEQLLNFLLAEGDLLFADYNGTQKVEASSTGKYTITIPMAVLVNSRTGGCAEAFAAALRDYAGAKLVGEQTMGKASLLTTFKCKDGSAIRFTAANLYTSKTQFAQSGLAPDYEQKLSESVVIGSNGANDEQLKLAKSILLTGDSTSPQESETTAAE